MARQPDALAAVVEWVARHDVDVEWEDGWRTHGGTRFAPKGLTVHHDASPRGSDIRHIHRDGHSRLSGPLCNLYPTRNGTLVVIAAGRANHAGRGGWQGLRGNSSVWGIEIANDGQGEPYGDEQLRVVRLLMRAFHVVDGVPVGLIHSHHEWRSEKPDPAVDPQTRSGPWHMDRFRRELRQQPNPEPDDMEDLMAAYGPPLQIVRDEHDRWYLYFRWDEQYAYIANGDALTRLLDRATRDDRYADTRTDWRSEWLQGMKRVEDRK